MSAPGRYDRSAEADRWLAAPLRPARVVVHGVAGGVGTTTVAGLLRAALERRPGDGGAVPVVDGGRDALLPGAGDLSVVPVVVCSATAHGLGLAARTLGAATAGTAPPATARRVPGSHRAVVVAVPVAGRGLDGRTLLRAAAAAGLTDEVVPLPWSRALAAGAGPLALTADRVLAGRIDAVAAAVVRCARRRAAVTQVRSR